MCCAFNAECMIMFDYLHVAHTRTSHIFCSPFILIIIRTIITVRRINEMNFLLLIPDLFCVYCGVFDRGACARQPEDIFGYAIRNSYIEKIMNHFYIWIECLSSSHHTYNSEVWILRNIRNVTGGPTGGIRYQIAP